MAALATQVASIQAQAISDTSALQMLVVKIPVGQNLQLVADSTALVAKLGELGQLAAAVLADTKAPAPAATPGPDAAAAAENCKLLKEKYVLFSQIGATTGIIATTDNGPPLFIALSKFFQNGLGCQGKTTSFCVMAQGLVAQLVADANNVQRKIDSMDSEIRIGQIKAAISDGVRNAQDGIVELEDSLGCQ